MDKQNKLEKPTTMQKQTHQNEQHNIDKPKTTTTMKKQDKINSYITFNKAKQQQYNNHLKN